MSLQPPQPPPNTPRKEPAKKRYPPNHPSWQKRCLATDPILFSSAMKAMRDAGHQAVCLYCGQVNETVRDNYKVTEPDFVVRACLRCAVKHQEIRPIGGVEDPMETSLWSGGIKK